MHSVFFYHQYNLETKHKDLSEISSILFLLKLLFNYQMNPKLTQLIIYHIVYDCFTGRIIQENITNLSETANTVCLIKSPFNEQMYLQSTQ